ncbi:RNA polymerase sigma factor [Streptomyces fractus]|uniref:RNA polymerase sigma factor n=1 Tax=Streptomyces fractus TaxID=641806 RepID=UPI003CFB1E85
MTGTAERDEAVRQLWLLHHDEIVAYARELLGAPDEDAVQDLVAEAFARLLDGLPDAAGTTLALRVRVVAILGGVAAEETALRYVERARPPDELPTSAQHAAALVTCRGETDPVLAAAPLHRYMGDPNALLVERIGMHAAIRRAFAALSDRQASMLVLVCLRGMSVPRAAEQIGVSAGAAHALLRRGRHAFRRTLVEYDRALASRDGLLEVRWPERTPRGLIR